MTYAVFRGAASGRSKQGPTSGHARALSRPPEGRSPYAASGVSS